MEYLDYLPTLPSLLAEPGLPLLHRDLSWIQFNERVLDEARAASNPLLERVKFLSITASNMDEFCMIRFPSVVKQLARAGKKDPSSIRGLVKIRSAILESLASFGADQVEVLETVAAELDQVGIQIVRSLRPEEPSYAVAQKIFDEEIMPKLTPPEGFMVSAIGSLENLQIAVIFMKGNLWFKIPKTISASFVRSEGETSYFFFLDDLLQTFLPGAFRLSGQPILIRLTRDGDFSIDLEEEDFEAVPDLVKSGLKDRDRGRPLRLQYMGDTEEKFLSNCSRVLRLHPSQVLPANGSLCLHGLWSGMNQMPESISGKPGLRHPPLKTYIPEALAQNEGVFERLQQHDILLHHPYDSFDAFVGLIQVACKDPKVVSIEQTIYRMDAYSPIIDALKEASASGKKVRVMIELRARFDELNNLRLADELRKVGIEVAFGFGKLKLHAKVALITRQEGDKLMRYTHLSTGNYNATTSRLYTDMATITANPDVGADARHFFDSAMKGVIPTTFKTLLSAPTKMHKRLLAHIDEETQAAREKKSARIVAKVNALVDKDVIEKLYTASRAGVQVDLIVRGACSLIPGVKGLSENIRVVGIVDRFLEHSRLYYFGSSKALYLSSADWMPRNFFSRLELAFPVLDPNIKKYLEEVVIPVYLSDNVKARELTPQGIWKKRTLAGRKQSPFGKQTIRAQFYFEQLAGSGYKGTPIERVVAAEFLQPAVSQPLKG